MVCLTFFFITTSFIFVKMAGDCRLNALSLLPENVLPQWQQKIASRKIIARQYYVLFLSTDYPDLTDYFVRPNR